MERIEIIFYALHYVCLLVELILFLGERYAKISKKIKKLREVSIMWTFLHIINLLFLLIVSENLNRIYPLIALIFQIIIVVAKGIKHVKFRNISFIISCVMSIIGLIIKIIQVKKIQLQKQQLGYQKLATRDDNNQLIAYGDESDKLNMLIRPVNIEQPPVNIEQNKICKIVDFEDRDKVLFQRDISMGKKVNDILTRYNNVTDQKKTKLFFNGEELSNDTKLSDLNNFNGTLSIKNPSPRMANVNVKEFDGKLNYRNPLYVNDIRDLWNKVFKLYPAIKNKDEWKLVYNDKEYEYKNLKKYENNIHIHRNDVFTLVKVEEEEEF